MSNILMSLNEKRLLMLIFSKIDSRYTDNAINVTMNQYADIFNVPFLSDYDEFERGIRMLNHKAYAKQNGIMYYWISGYSKCDDLSINIYLNPALSDSITQLKSEFQQHDMLMATKLNNEFAFKLFQWLKIDLVNRQYQKGGYNCLKLDIEEMKRLSGMRGAYQVWSMFKKHVLDVAVEQINEKTKIEIIYEPIKKGRAFKTIEFKWRKKDDE